MAIQESGEMYLETVLILSQRMKSVHSVDISEYMGFSKPSVSRAVGLLKNGGYITVEQDGSVFLTDEGCRVAEKIYERHTLLSDFLINIGVGRETAIEDACKIEHDISDETFNAIKKLADRYRKEE